MVSEQPTRTVIRRLRDAGFVESDAKGSHTKWKHPTTGVMEIVPTGHRTISPGIVRKVDKAIERSNEAMERSKNQADEKREKGAK